MTMPNLNSRIKSAIWQRFAKLAFLSKPSIRYCVEHELLPTLITKTPSAALRSALRLPHSPYETQLNQDVFALLTNRLRPGFFVDIGANDGYTLSNTIYLEQHFGWKGILIEANPKYQTSLEQRKGAKVVIKAVASGPGMASFVDAGLYGGLESSLDSTHQQKTAGASTITVECDSLDAILLSAGAPHRVDFVSIDIEGGELPIVEQLAKSSYRFSAGCVEHNFRPKEKQQIMDLLMGGNYRVTWEDQTGHDLFFEDVTR